MLKIAIVGDVDTGKSTLVGNILQELNPKKYNKKVLFKITDTLKEEVSSYKTMSSSRYSFKYDKFNQDIVLINCPGHLEYFNDTLSKIIECDIVVLVEDYRTVNNKEYLKIISKVCIHLNKPIINLYNNKIEDLTHYQILKENDYVFDFAKKDEGLLALDFILDIFLNFTLRQYKYKKNNKIYSMIFCYDTKTHTNLFNNPQDVYYYDINGNETFVSAMYLSETIISTNDSITISKAYIDDDLLYLFHNEGYYIVRDTQKNIVGVNLNTEQFKNLYMDRLSILENESKLFIKNSLIQNNKYFDANILYSMGKDSTVMYNLILDTLKKEDLLLDKNLNKSLIHIDTSRKIPEMITFRDKIFSQALEFDFKNVVVMSDTLNLNHVQDIKFKPISSDLTSCCHTLKTLPLLDVIYGENKYRYKEILDNNSFKEITLSNKMDSIFIGARGDEESTRSKESMVSLRTKDTLKLEVQNIFVLEAHRIYGEISKYNDNHYRLYPLLRWTELDIWEYISKYETSIIPLYFSKDGGRYRSIGCECCSSKIKSCKSTANEILLELKNELFSIPERSTRKQDDEYGLETLRTKGYM